MKKSYNKQKQEKQPPPQKRTSHPIPPLLRFQSLSLCCLPLMEPEILKMPILIAAYLRLFSNLWMCFPSTPVSTAIRFISLSLDLQHFRIMTWVAIDPHSTSEMNHNLSTYTESRS